MRGKNKNTQFKVVSKLLGNFEYKIIRNYRSCALRITIYPNNEIKVSAPYLMPEFVIKNFVERKRTWIEKKLEYFKNRPFSKFRLFLNSLKRKDYLEQKANALALVKERLTFYNKHYKVNYNKVTIRNQKSRWGSCSHTGNLNFNYKIVYLPKEVQDYIVVHELCHIKEMNHSKTFWKLVAEMVPNYKNIRQVLN